MNPSDASLREQLAKLRQAAVPGARPAPAQSTSSPSWETLLDKALAPGQGEPQAAVRTSNMPRDWSDARAVAANAGPEAIVILRPDSIGDLILFEPLLRILREAWGQTRIHVVGTRNFDAVARLMPSGVSWHAVEGAAPFEAPTREAIGRLQSGIGQIPGRVWLLSACTRKTWWDSAVPALRPFDRRISLGSVPMSEGLRLALSKAGLDGALPGYLETIPVSSESHEWENVLECASYLLGCAAPRIEPRLRVPEEADEAAGAVLADVSLEAGRFVACCPAGTANVGIKVWSAGRFARVLADLQHSRGLGVLLVGIRSEQEILNDVAARVAENGGAARVWMGETLADFEVLCGLLARASLYLGNDTGPMHAAAALGRPVVGIFGGGTWPRFLPRASSGAAVVRPMPCFGCDWQCHLGDAPCLKLVEVDTVRRAALAALDGTSGPLKIVRESSHPSPEIDDLARGAAQHARSLKGQLEHLAKVSEEQAAYLSSLESEKRGLLDLVATRTEEAEQRLKTILEQNALISGMESRVGSLESERARIASEFEAARARLEETRLEIDRQYATIGEQTRYLASLEAEREALRTSIAEWKGWHGQAAAERDRLAAVSNEQQAYIATLEGNQQALNASLTSLQAERDRLAAVATEQQSYITTLERDRKALSTSLSALQAERDRLAANLARLEEAAARTGEQLRDTREALARKQVLTTHLVRQYEAAARQAAESKT